MQVRVVGGLFHQGWIRRAPDRRGAAAPGWLASTPFGGATRALWRRRWTNSVLVDSQNSNAIPDTFPVGHIMAQTEVSGTPPQKAALKTAGSHFQFRFPSATGFSTQNQSAVILIEFMGSANPGCGRHGCHKVRKAEQRTIRE